MLKFEGVKKHYEDFELDLTLEVPEGYVTGLIGANGAGKSTLIKCLGACQSYDTGEIFLEGKKMTAVQTQVL